MFCELLVPEWGGLIGIRVLKGDSELKVFQVYVLLVNDSIQAECS